jgi:hypothetical protein
LHRLDSNIRHLVPQAGNDGILVHVLEGLFRNIRASFLTKHILT